MSFRFLVQIILFDISPYILDDVSHLLVYGLSVIQDPLLVDSRVSKDTVIVGLKNDTSRKADTKEDDNDKAAMLQSEEVSPVGVQCRLRPKCFC